MFGFIGIGMLFDEDIVLLVVEFLVVLEELRILIGWMVELFVKIKIYFVISDV